MNRPIFYWQKNKGILKFNFSMEHENHLNTHAIARACEDMAKTKTGAIMVVTQMDDLAVFAESGVAMNAEISVPMIESIFYKNSPLHDGAVIIRDNKKYVDAGGHFIICFPEIKIIGKNENLSSL